VKDRFQVTGYRLRRIRAARFVVGVILFLSLAEVMLGQVQSRYCTDVPVTTKTRWGGNEIVEIDLRNKPVRTVRGVVLGPGAGSLKTLVQAFARKSSDSVAKASDEEQETPIATCETGDDGLFGFSLPPGPYELRMSQNSGVDVTLVDVIVKRGWRRSREIRVVMKNGD
jgi:hypothetical protein